MSHTAEIRPTTEAAQPSRVENLRRHIAVVGAIGASAVAFAFGGERLVSPDSEAPASSPPTPLEAGSYYLHKNPLGGKLSLQSGTYSPRKWAAPPLERSATDRPDDFNGPQVHVIYAVAADKDGNFDTNGGRDVIQRSQDWLAGATEGALSLAIDTKDGQPDISFFRSPRSASAIEGQAVGIQDIFGEELKAAGFSDPSKTYLLLYDGRISRGPGNNDPLCGVADWPPSNPGNVAVVSLDTTACGDPMDSAGKFQYRDLIIPHEIFHALGAVPSEAPHSDGYSHSTDFSDLMYGQGWYTLAEAEKAKVDPGHDDYWYRALPELGLYHYRQNISITGGGTVEADQAPNRYLGQAESYCTDDCVMWFGRGALVGFTASPESSSWRFKKWESSQPEQKSRNTNSYGMVVDGEETLRAIFEPIVNLNVLVRGKGSVRILGQKACADSCKYELKPGGKVNLIAKPAKGMRLVRWVGNCGTKANLRCTLPLKHEHDLSAGAVFSRQSLKASRSKG
jgi:hypothetical protein